MYHKHVLHFLVWIWRERMCALALVRTLGIFSKWKRKAPNPARWMDRERERQTKWNETKNQHRTKRRRTATRMIVRWPIVEIYQLINAWLVHLPNSFSHMGLLRLLVPHTNVCPHSRSARAHTSYSTRCERERAHSTMLSTWSCVSPFIWVCVFAFIWETIVPLIKCLIRSFCIDKCIQRCGPEHCLISKSH